MRRAIGVVRVSRVGDREGESFVSPSEQRDRIAAECERSGLALLNTLEEPNVSGGAPLARRHGLRKAVEAVEAGTADVIVVAYFDRLVRSLAVQAEVVERVERANGGILAVDVGEVRADTASRWLSSTLLGMVAEYHRRVTAERTHDSKRRAVARGVAPFPSIPPGYRKGKAGKIEVDPDTAAAVREAFVLRASGEPIMKVREHLRTNGVVRSFHGVQAMLGSRVYLGELRFGNFVNPTSHEAIVDRDTWDAVQRARVSRGRRAKSDRLLARLGVLRCATCGGRMIVGTQTQNGRSYPFYRCSPIGDCLQRVAVSAELVEGIVVTETQRVLAEDKLLGSPNMGTEIVEAEREAERRQTDLDAAIRAFDGLDVEAARERLAELRDAHENARERLADLRAAAPPAFALSATRDWSLLSGDERRFLVRSVIKSVTVGPGRGAGRILVEPFEENPPRGSV